MLYFGVDTDQYFEVGSACDRHGGLVGGVHGNVFGRCSLSPAEGHPQSTRPANFPSCGPPATRAAGSVHVYPPWYLDPCLGIPIPGRASSARRSLHRPRSEASRENNRARCRSCFTFHATHRTYFAGPWVLGGGQVTFGGREVPGVPGGNRQHHAAPFFFPRTRIHGASLSRS